MDAIKIYRTSVWNRFFSTLLCLGSVAVGGFFIYRASLNRSFLELAVMLTIFLPFAVIFTYLALDSFIASLEIYPDRMIIAGLSGRREVYLRDLSGFRVTASGNAKLVELIPVSGSGPIRLSASLAGRGELMEWLGRNLKDLDKEERDRELKEALSDEKLGATQEEKEANFGKYLSWDNTLSTVTFVLALWLFLYPSPHQLLVLANAAVPLAALALVWKSGGFIQVENEGRSAHPSIAISLFVPPAALAWDAFRYYYFSFSDILLPTAIIAFCLALIFETSVGSELKDSRSRGYLLLAAAAMGLAYAVSFNCVLDSSAPEVFRAKVAGKRVVRGRHSTSYYFTLDRSYRWSEYDVAVPGSVYGRTRVKDEFCLYRRKGLFDIPWYVGDPCEKP